VRSLIPNGLTVVRLILAILLPFQEPHLWWWFFVVACATEFLDGFLSRVLDARSDFGRISDPIADKAFVLSLVLVLLFNGLLPLLHLLLIALRDVVVVLGSFAILAFGRRGDVLRLKPRWVGKTATVFQFVFLGWLLRAGPPPQWLLGLTAVVGLVAGIDYVFEYRRAVREPAARQDP
jgi:CDP-diacylglycerol--glycerol-3-phosphate 3-phosphatidyltransferase